MDYTFTPKEINPNDNENDTVHLRAVYEENGKNVLKPIVTIGINKRFYESDTLQRVRVQVLFDSIPDMTVIEKGILTTLDETKSGDKLTLAAVDNSTVRRSSSVGEWQSGSLILNATMKDSNANLPMYCRGYMTYRKSDDTLVTEYTEPKTIEAVSATNQ